jgi:hypothetical protein
MVRHKTIVALVIALALNASAFAAHLPEDDAVGKKVDRYFERLGIELQASADKKPTSKTFASDIKNVVWTNEDLCGAYFLDTDWIVRKSLFPLQIFMVGHDYRTDPSLDHYRTMVTAFREPKLLAPMPRTFIRPGRITMTCPVFDALRVTGYLSVEVSTQRWLNAVGLDRAKAYRIVCDGKESLKKGKIPFEHHTVTMSMFSSTWVIEYVM